MSGGVSNWPPSGSGSGVATYPTFADFPVSAANGTLAIALDTDTLYIYDSHTMMWEVLASPSGLNPAPGSNGQLLYNNNGFVGADLSLTDGSGNLTARTLILNGPSSNLLLEVAGAFQTDGGSINSDGFGDLSAINMGLSGNIYIQGTLTSDFNQITSNGGGNLTVNDLLANNYIQAGSSGISSAGTITISSTGNLDINGSGGIFVSGGGITSLDNGAVATDGSGNLTAVSLTVSQFVALNSNGFEVGLFGSPVADATYEFVLPPDGGTSAYVLSTDGTGVTSWVPNGGTPVTPGGANTSIQFNDGGAFNGFGTWDGTTFQMPDTANFKLGTSGNGIEMFGSSGEALFAYGSSSVGTDIETGGNVSFGNTLIFQPGAELEDTTSSVGSANQVLSAGASGGSAVWMSLPPSSITVGTTPVNNPSADGGLLISESGTLGQTANIYIGNYSGSFPYMQFLPGPTINSGNSGNSGNSFPDIGDSPYWQINGAGDASFASGALIWDASGDITTTGTLSVVGITSLDNGSIVTDGSGGIGDPISFGWSIASNGAVSFAGGQFTSDASGDVVMGGSLNIGSTLSASGSFATDAAMIQSDGIGNLTAVSFNGNLNVGPSGTIEDNSGSTGTSGQFLSSGTGGQAIWTSATPGGATQPNLQILTSGTSYTTPSGSPLYLKVTIVGGGGGGGGAAGSSGNGGGGGGGGGGTAIFYIQSPSGSYTYSIGAGGGSGTPTASGGNGGSTIFNSQAAGGGVGGSSAMSGIVGAVSGTGGVGTGPYLNIPGSDGVGGGIGALGVVSGFGGSGGGSALAGAAYGGNLNGGQPGAPGKSYGGGGGGAIFLNNGGPGANGVVIVEAFYQ